MTVQVETDPLREIDDRLVQWGKWRNQQDQLLQGIKPSSVNRMAGEMAEARRKGMKPRQISQAAYACMIHGTGGDKPESHFDDAAEWETQEALDRMPSAMDTIKAVIDIEYRKWDTQERKANILRKRLKTKISVRTYKQYKNTGLYWVQAYFEGKNIEKTA